MRRELAILAVVLAAGAFSLWPGADPPVPPIHIADGAAAGPDQSNVPAGPANAAGAPDREPLAASDRSPVAAASTAASGPTITVVHGTPAQPVADATCWFVDERAYDRHRLSANGISRFEAPRRLGRAAPADRSGRVTLPAMEGRWLVSVAHQGQFGFAAIAASPGQHTLPLLPDRELLVEVVDHDARPAAGVPLVVLQTDPRRTRGIWYGASDERGRARVRHLHMLRHQQPAGFAPRFAVMARLPVTPVCIGEFPAASASSETVRLQLPPLGVLEVRLVDHCGNPLLSPAQVVLGVRGDVPDALGLQIPAHLLTRSVTRPPGTAPLRVPFAALQDEATLVASYPYDNRTGSSAPTADRGEIGAARRIEIRPHATQGVFAGRLRFADGRAVANEQVDVLLWCNDAIELDAKVHTIDDGRFDLVSSRMRRPGRWRLRFRRVATGAGPDASLGATVELPPWSADKRIELGDVVLDKLPVLVRGVVVDDRDVPIAGARVGIQQAPTQNRARLRAMPHLRTASDADGAFTIRAERPAGTLRVYADGPGHLGDSVPLAATGQEVRVVLPRNGALRGRVLLPPWLPAGAVTLTMVPSDPNRRRTDTRSGRVSTDGGGQFQIEPLRPGHYDLQVRLRNIDAPLPAIQDVVITPGITTDARLEPLDLSQALYRYRLHARDAAGTMLPWNGPILARLVADDGSTVEAGFRWQNGTAELITAHRTAELTFFGRGYRPMRRQFAPGEHDVVFEPLLPAMVAVPGARGLCGPTRKVRISAILQGDTGYPQSLSGVDQRTGRHFSFPRWDLGRSSGGWLGASDLVEIPLMVAGRYQIILRAHATESTQSPQVSVTLGTFELVPDGTTVVTVPVDAVKVATALREVDARLVTPR